MTEANTSLGTDETPDATPRFSVIAGNPSPAELAAVSAVLSAAVEEQGDLAPDADPSRQSAWQRSQRGIRTPLTRGAGAWRSFSG